MDRALSVRGAIFALGDRAAMSSFAIPQRLQTLLKSIGNRNFPVPDFPESFVEDYL
jgi:hypothetical protein